MKRLDFSYTGGFPLTQDRLKNMQEADMEALSGFLSILGDGSTPIILSGMELTVEGLSGFTVGYTHSLTEGWFYYSVPGGVPQIYYVPEFSLSYADSGIRHTFIDIVETVGTLAFNNGLNHPVIVDAHGSMAVNSSNTTTPTHLLYSSFITFAEAMGLNCRETEWVDLPLSHTTGSVSGTLSYKKNRLTNQLEYKYGVVCFNPSALADAPDGNYLTLGYLPTEYVPTYDANLSGGILAFIDIFTQKGFLGLSTGGHITNLNITIRSTGEIATYLVKPNSTFSIYAFLGAGVVSLD